MWWWDDRPGPVRLLSFSMADYTRTHTHTHTHTHLRARASNNISGSLELPGYCHQPLLQDSALSSSHSWHFEAFSNLLKEVFIHPGSVPGWIHWPLAFSKVKENVQFRAHSPQNRVKSNRAFEKLSEQKHDRNLVHKLYHGTSASFI